MSNPKWSNFFLITTMLILIDTLFVDVESIPGATLVFIKGYQTTVNTIFFIIAFGFMLTSLNRAKQPRYYTAKLQPKQSELIKE